MEIKKILKSMTSGLAAVAVAASTAIGGYAANFNSGLTNVGVSNGILSQIFEPVQSLFDGKTDFGYKSNLNITFGDGFKKVAEIDSSFLQSTFDMNLLGFLIKSLDKTQFIKYNNYVLNK